MPAELADLRAVKHSEPNKILLIGDSGMGKSGSLVSLVKAGYRLRMLDFDNGGKLIRNLLKREAPDAVDDPTRVSIIPLTDSWKNQNGRLVPKANSWTRAMTLLSKWSVGKEGEPGHYDLGPLYSWGPDVVLATDSLDHAGDAIMRYHQLLSGNVGTHPKIQDWGSVQTIVRNFLEMLNDSEVKCNSVVITHIDRRYKDILNDKGNMVIGRELIGEFPNAPGRALPEEVGSYFNDALQVYQVGAGSGARRKIGTIPQGFLGLKTSNPGQTKKEYPIETGLAEFFKDLQA